jgi:thiol:disulfide interchange protein
MRRRALLFGLLGAACGKSRLTPPSLFWFEDVDLAYGEAKRLRRPVFLYFGATWDCASKELEHQTFPHPEVASLLHEGFVCAHVDCSDDENPKTMELTRRFGMLGTPTLLVTCPYRAREQWRANEFMKPDALAGVLARYRA